MHIADVVNAVHRLGTDLVRGSDGVASFGASSGEPHGHGFGIVIATVRFAASHAIVGRAAKFTAPHDQCIV